MKKLSIFLVLLLAASTFCTLDKIIYKKVKPSYIKAHKQEILDLLNTYYQEDNDTCKGCIKEAQDLTNQASDLLHERNAIGLDNLIKTPFSHFFIARTKAKAKDRKIVSFFAGNFWDNPPSPEFQQLCVKTLASQTAFKDFTQQFLTLYQKYAPGEADSFIKKNVYVQSLEAIKDKDIEVEYYSLRKILKYLFSNNYRAFITVTTDQQTENLITSLNKYDVTPLDRFSIQNLIYQPVLQLVTPKTETGKDTKAWFKQRKK